MTSSNDLEPEAFLESYNHWIEQAKEEWAPLDAPPRGENVPRGHRSALADAAPQRVENVLNDAEAQARQTAETLVKKAVLVERLEIHSEAHQALTKLLHGNTDWRDLSGPELVAAVNCLHAAGRAASTASAIVNKGDLTGHLSPERPTPSPTEPVPEPTSEALAAPPVTGRAI